jgi:hypothetical protein
LKLEFRFGWFGAILSSRRKMSERKSMESRSEVTLEERRRDRA